MFFVAFLVIFGHFGPYYFSKVGLLGFFSRLLVAANPSRPQLETNQ